METSVYSCLSDDSNPWFCDSVYYDTPSRSCSSSSSSRMSYVNSRDENEPMCEDDFPFLSSVKPEKRAEKGRRCGVGRTYTKKASGQAWLVKHVEDPQQVLGKRRKARVLSECADNMAEGVVYSMNRKNRWNTTNASTMLATATPSDARVVVVESTLTTHDDFLPMSDHNVQAAHTLDDNGCIQTKTVKGKGKAMRHLLKKEKKKETSEEVEKASDEEKEENDDEEKKPTLVYRFMKPHHKAKEYHGNYPCRKERTGRRNKKIDVSDLESSEMDKSVHIEESSDTYKPSRDFKFNLGDFIQDAKTSSAVTETVRRESFESIQNVDDIDCLEFVEIPSPFHRLNISNILQQPGLFHKFSIDIQRWTSFSLVEQVDILKEDQQLSVLWLDGDHQRVLVDLTDKLVDKETHIPELVVVLEKEGSNLWITINSMHASKRVDKKDLECRIVGNLKPKWKICDVISNVVSIVKLWMTSQKGVVEEELKNKELFQAAVNSHRLANVATVIPQQDLVDLLREFDECEQEDAFERISDDDLTSELEGYEGILIADRHKAKCQRCSSSSSLYELDDCWMCVDCLHKMVLNKIRSGHVPLDIPLIVYDDCTGYDMLPAIIPLRLFHFYTNAAASEVLSHEDGEEAKEMFHCPSCKHLLRVPEDQNYSTCLCSGCGLSWCSDCSLEPHWPMDCAQFAEWKAKWAQQYPLDVNVEDVAEFIKKFTCKCGQVNNVADTQEDIQKCSSCGSKFDAVSLVKCSEFVEVSPRQRPYFKHYYANNPVAAYEHEKIPVSKIIRKEIAEPCFQARKQRLSRQKNVEFMKLSRRVKSDLTLAQIYDLRRTVLHMVEFGLAKIYLEKSTKDKTSLMALFKQFESLLSDLEQNKPDMESSLKDLQQNLEKVIEQYKKSCSIVP